MHSVKRSDDFQELRFSLHLVNRRTFEPNLELLDHKYMISSDHRSRFLKFNTGCIMNDIFRMCHMSRDRTVNFFWKMFNLVQHCRTSAIGKKRSRIWFWRWKNYSINNIGAREQNISRQSKMVIFLSPGAPRQSSEYNY